MKVNFPFLQELVNEHETYQRRRKKRNKNNPAMHYTIKSTRRGSLMRCCLILVDLHLWLLLFPPRLQASIQYSLFMSIVLLWYKSSYILMYICHFKKLKSFIKGSNSLKMPTYQSMKEISKTLEIKHGYLSSLYFYSVTHLFNKGNFR